MTQPTVKTNAQRIENLEKLTEKLAAIVVGNGARGMDEVTREIERRVGDVENDMKEVKQMLQEIVGYAGVRYDEQINPGRRKEDKTQTSKDKFRDAWDKATEDILGKFLTAAFIILILKLKEIIDLFAGLLTG